MGGLLSVSSSPTTVIGSDLIGSELMTASGLCEDHHRLDERDFSVGPRLLSLNNTSSKPPPPSRGKSERVGGSTKLNLFVFRSS